MNFNIFNLMMLVIAVIYLMHQNPAYSQDNPSPQSIPYFQEFSLVHSSTSYPVGWQGWTVSTSPGAGFNTAEPTANNTMNANSDASSSNGSVHNYEGKIGFLNTSSLDLAIVLAINTSAKSDIEVSYEIMTVRNPYDGAANNRINAVSLQYRVGSSGSFTTISGVEYENNTTTQTSATTSGQNIQKRTLNLPSVCDNEAVVQLRWISAEVSGSGDSPSFAIDNVVVTDDASKPVSPAAQSIPYSQDFLSLPHSSSSFPDGWQGHLVSGNTSSQYKISPLGSTGSLSNSSSASTSAGGIHNFNGKIGFLNTNTNDHAIVLSINTTGKTGIEVDYAVMTIRNPYNATTNTRIGEISLQYRIGESGVFTNLSATNYSNNTVSQTSGSEPQNLQTINVLLPAVCDDQAVVQLRWLAVDVSGIGSRPSFAIDNIYVLDAASQPASTDYFRSRQSGLFSSTTSWVSSVNNTEWINAVMLPDFGANTIVVRNGHTITLSADAELNQLEIESGGVFDYNSGVLTLNNGSGDDIVVRNGGIFRLTKTSAGTIVFNSGASFRIEGGGVFQANVSTGPAGNYANDNSTIAFQNSMIWDDGSIFHWNNSSGFSASARNYFPQVSTSVTPILRVSNMTTSVGASNPLTVNGVLEANSNFTLEGSGEKRFRNGITGSGSITQSADCGKLLINGDNAVLGGSGSINISTAGLEIASTCTLSVISNKSISGGVLINEGVVDLNDKILDLGSTASVSGSGVFIASGNQDGVLTSNKSFAASVVSSENIGGLGAVLNIGSPYTGTITVVRGCKIQKGTDDNEGISRYYDISTTGSNTGLDAELVFHYHQDELNSYAESQLKLFKSNDAGSNWTLMNTTRDEINKTLSISHIDGFSRWTAGSEAALLPVEMLSFSAERNHESVVLKWITATETINAGFEVERSVDARHFETIGFIQGEGNSNSLRSYQFTDHGPPPQTAYYRLKQLDYNGRFSHTEILAVNGVKTAFKAYYSGGKIYVSFNDLHGRLLMQVFDISGRIVLTEEFVAGENHNIKLKLPTMTKGVYLLRIQSDTSCKTELFLVE